MFIETKEGIRINVTTFGDENNPAVVLLKNSMDPSNLVSPEEFDTEVLKFINN